MNWPARTSCSQADCKASQSRLLCVCAGGGALCVLPNRYMGRANALQLGGGSAQADRFANELWPTWAAWLPTRTTSTGHHQAAPYDGVRELLAGFNGQAWGDVTARDVDDAYARLPARFSVLHSAMRVPPTGRPCCVSLCTTPPKRN